MIAFPHLFQPISIGDIRLRNRLMMTTHGTKLSEVRYLRYLEERASGGVGLIGIPAANGGRDVFDRPRPFST